MTTPQPLWGDNEIIAAYRRAFERDPDVHIYALMTWIRDDYEAALEARLEGHRAAFKPRIRKAETGIRGGLLKGRIRLKGVREASQVRPTFDAALQMATTDDLWWALELLIKHPHTKRTWRDHRIKHIDARLRELTGLREPQP